MKVLMIDNYDSFTYNLVHYLQELGAEVEVKRNDKISVKEALVYSCIVLSPGPGLPSQAGIMMDLLAQAGPNHHILGVCLGHQAIAEQAGAQLLNMPEVFHGVASECEVLVKSSLFEHIPQYFKAGRYHSWTVNATGNSAIEILAVERESRSVMGLKHSLLPQYGVQFHPESILSEYGHQLLANFLHLASGSVEQPPLLQINNTSNSRP